MFEAVGEEWVIVRMLNGIVPSTPLTDISLVFLHVWQNLGMFFATELVVGA